jgi:hypothetical protein
VLVGPSSTSFTIVPSSHISSYSSGGDVAGDASGLLLRGKRPGWSSVFARKGALFVSSLVGNTLFREAMRRSFHDFWPSQSVQPFCYRSKSQEFDQLCNRCERLLQCFSGPKSVKITFNLFT